MSVLCIAEIGSAWVFTDDWDRSYLNALRAIHIACDAGANVIKFQWTSNPIRMAVRRRVHGKKYWQLAWPGEWHEVFAEEARNNGIEYMCTVFLAEDVATVAPHVGRFKIASLEMNDLGLRQAMLDARKPIIVSTGCQPDALKIPWYKHIHVLHCIAAYPAPLGELNLGVIRRGFDGFSDHSANVLTGAIATAAGAKIIEVHFRLSRTPKDNPDYPHSLEPRQLNEYIQNVRMAEAMMGDGVKRVMPSEEALLQHVVTT